MIGLQLRNALRVHTLIRWMFQVSFEVWSRCVFLYKSSIEDRHKFVFTRELIINQFQQDCFNSVDVNDSQLLL